MLMLAAAAFATIADTCGALMMFMHMLAAPRHAALHATMPPRRCHDASAITRHALPDAAAASDAAAFSPRFAAACYAAAAA